MQQTGNARYSRKPCEKRRHEVVGHVRVVLFGLVIAVTALLGCARQRAVRQATKEPSPAVDIAGLPDDQERPSEPESAFSRRVDRANLEEYAKIVAEGIWWREMSWRTNSDDLHIRDIQIVLKETLDQTVVPAKTVHLVVAHVEASWWKNNADIVMVFEPQYTFESPREDLYGFRPLVVNSTQQPSYEVVNLGTDGIRYALVVRDERAGNAWSATDTYIYLYQEGLHEVFSEATSYWHPPWGQSRWTEKQIEFREGGRPLKDIVVTAHVEKWHGETDYSPGYRKIVDEDRVSVFTWDGERYVGEMNVDD